MFGKILDTASLLKAKIKKDELEIALAEATTEDNWQASTTVLHEISSSAYDREKWRKISDFLWDKMKNKKNWKKILKSMNIVEFLLKNGPQFTCGELRMELRFFRALESFQEYEGSIDRGASIRQRAKAIVELLQNDEFLEDERLRSHQIREKMSQMSGARKGPSEGRPQSSHVPKYDSYNSQSFSSSAKDNNKGYYNYGHGNYGDRVEDKKFDHDYFGNANRFRQNENPDRERPRSSVTVPDNQPPPEPTYEPTKPTPYVYSGPAPGKNNFSSITQSLMKKKKKQPEVRAVVEEGVVKPDFSYKKKDQVQPFDLEEAFMENRYQFDEKPQQPEPRYQPTNPVVTPSVRPLVEAPPQPQPNLMSQLDTINFLGGPSPSTAVSQPTPEVVQPTPPAPVQPAFHPVVQPAQPTQQSIAPAPISSQSIYSQPGLVSAPMQPLNPCPLYFQPPAPLPTYNYPGSYNQFNTYNSFGTSYYNPAQTAHYPVPVSNPGYPVQPVYPVQPTYPVQPPPSQAPYNPYANVQSNTGPIGLGTVTFTPEESLKSEPAKPKKASNSSSSGLGNLTDLSDIMQDIESSKNTPKKKPSEEFNNGIKIDQWAW